jgi:DNA excision repair protein ERCC-4
MWDSYLVSYDSVSFYQYLEGILATQSTGAGGQGRQNQSPWLFLDAAQVIFNTAKSRAYTGNVNANNTTSRRGIPPGLTPVLEEQPKWKALSSILEEIEREMHFNPTFDDSPGAILVMCTDSKECQQLREYLQTVNLSLGEGGVDADADEENDEKPSHSAAYMMRRRLRGYLAWKRDLSRFKAVCSELSRPRNAATAQVQKRQQESFRGRAPPNKRRRTRGGAANGSAGPSRTAGGSVQVSEDQESHVAELWKKLQPTEEEEKLKEEIAVDPLDNMENYYELFDLQSLVVVYPFKGDMDDRLLEELRPRYIIMYNPDTAFVRRVEVSTP